jgi:hypothetical protein
MRERGMREAQLEEKQAISRARKERMLKMEADAKNKVSAESRRGFNTTAKMIV